MARRGAAQVREDIGRSRPGSQLPHLPVTDNEPGSLVALLKANKIFRGRRWPAPYDLTRHEMILGDARNLAMIPSESVHLIATSPPYFNLKPYASDAGGQQLGRINDYEEFLGELDRVWRECVRVLVPGGRICCVIGDILDRHGAASRAPSPRQVAVRLTLLAAARDPSTGLGPALQ